MEDTTYDQNIYISKETCIRRKAQVSDVFYGVSLALPRGEFFGGQVTVKFRLDGGGEDLFLDFRGIKIARLLVNGEVVEGKDVFRDHHIHLPTQFLKPNTSNTVSLFILSKYRKCGMGLHTFHDKQDSQQYIYTQFAPDCCHWLFPCFD